MPRTQPTEQVRNRRAEKRSSIIQKTRKNAAPLRDETASEILPVRDRATYCQECCLELRTCKRSAHQNGDVLVSALDKEKADRVSMQQHAAGSAVRLDDGNHRAELYEVAFLRIDLL
jgi:hypothetical protein